MTETPVSPAAEPSAPPKPRRMPADWTPPVPAYSAELRTTTTVAYLGIQSLRGLDAPETVRFRRWVASQLSGPDGPDVAEYADYTDRHGYGTWIAILSWRGHDDRAERWGTSEAFRDYWDSPERLEPDAGGVFREVYTTGASRWESIYSTPELQAGVATGCPRHAGPIREHNYWGSMRERLPISAEDGLAAPPTAASTADGARSTLGPGRRVRLRGSENTAIIHSGQLIGDMAPTEAAMYRDQLADALREGMDYLRDHPAESGCYSCRYLRETDGEGRPLERARTFGLAAFVSLDELESWAEHHPSHLKIFNAFLGLAKAVGGDPTLPLWHNVFVPRAAGQLLEYVGCHPGTGFLPYAAFEVVDA